MKEYRVEAEWVSGMQFVARGLESRGTFVMDAPEESGGAAQGIRPTEALLCSMAGCSGMDVVSILRKMRQDVTGMTVHVTGLRADDYPRPMVSADVEYVVTGRGLSEDAVGRAVRLSVDKYCGVMASLKAEVHATHRVVEA